MTVKTYSAISALVSLGWKGEEIDTQRALALLAKCLSLTDEEEKIYDCLTAWIDFYKGKNGALKEISDYPKEVYKAFKKEAKPLVDFKKKKEDFAQLEIFTNAITGPKDIACFFDGDYFFAERSFMSMKAFSDSKYRFQGSLLFASKGSLVKESGVEALGIGIGWYDQIKIKRNATSLGFDPGCGSIAVYRRKYLESLSKGKDPNPDKSIAYIGWFPVGKESKFQSFSLLCSFEELSDDEFDLLINLAACLPLLYRRRNKAKKSDRETFKTWLMWNNS